MDKENEKPLIQDKLKEEKPIEDPKEREKPIEINKPLSGGINSRDVYDNPLGLPKGSVRAIITIILLTMTFYLMASGKEIEQWFSTLVISSVGFYFGTREQTNTNLGNKK